MLAGVVVGVGVVVVDGRKYDVGYGNPGGNNDCLIDLMVKGRNGDKPKHCEATYISLPEDNIGEQRLALVIRDRTWKKELERLD